MIENKSIIIISLVNIPPKLGKWGTMLKIICDEKTPTESLMAGVATINSNERIDNHYHNIEELQYILRGKGVVYNREGKAHPIKQGDFVYCPSKEFGIHSFKNTGNEPLDIFYVYPSIGGKSPEIIIQENKEYSIKFFKT